jgi:hypothetical protein
MRPVPARDFTPGAPVAGGEPVGGEPVGGEPVGGEPVGGEPVGGEPAGPVDRYARYAILFTDDDTPLSWLRAGEALSATLLTATMLRLATSPLSDVVEVPTTRSLLRELLGGVGYPMIALRIGVPADGPPPPAAPRRSAHEIIDTP